MKKWKEFRAAAAYEITGMDVGTQRVKRRRGQIAPLTVEGGRAKLDAVLLGEMILVHELAPLFVVNALSAQNLTARTRAASWIAYWGAVASGASAEEAAQLAKRSETPPATHLVFSPDAKHWKRDFHFGDNPGKHLTHGKPVSIAVDLKALGERIATKAKGLLEDE